MFLILLLVFPALAYYLFSKFENDPKEISGLTKIIGLIGLGIIHFAILSEIFDSHETYLITMVFWYIGVFIFFYSKQIVILNKNFHQLHLEHWTVGKVFLMFGFLFFLVILYLNLMDKRREILQYFSFDRYSFDLWGILFLFCLNLVLFGVLYQMLDVFVKSFLGLKKSKDAQRVSLKQELKAEILKELEERK